MRLTVALWVAGFIAAIILQSTLIQTITIAGVKPDLVMIMLFLFSMKYGVVPGVFVGFIIGLGIDLYSPSLLGQNALAKTIVGGLAGVFNDRTIRTEPIVKIVIVLFSFVLHDAFFFAAQAAKSADSTFAEFVPMLLTTSLPRSLYSVVLVSLFYLWAYYVKPSSLR